MKKVNYVLLIILVSILFSAKNTFAYDINNYRYRSLCGNYEVSRFNEDGSIVALSCHNTYEQAKNAMRQNGEAGVAILVKIGNESKIIDANVALLDLSANKETLTYFYTNSELTGSAYTYMDNGSLYGGVDGAHLETAYSNSNGTWVAKVRIANFTGWVRQSTYEIVPITWVKSSSSYTVTNSDIRHNYVAKIQNYYNGSSGRTIGPKPSMLNEGKYYSYDGHYFYTDLVTLIKDYKAGNYNNSVNKNNPYYNYYMYLSNHTKTNYSSINIDEYIRNNLGYKMNVYGNAASSGTSRLYGSGTFFYYAQEKYGVNAILSLSLSRNETGNGTSSLSINKNNGFGLNAVDSNPMQAANWYASFASSILGYASKWITYGYAHPRDWRYFGPQFGDKWIGMNVKYASDSFWSEKMAANYYSLDKALGLQDYNYYQLGVVKGPTNAYLQASTSSRIVYTYPEKEDALVILEEINQNNQKWYKVVSDINLDNYGNEISSGNYNWNSVVYVLASQVEKINTPKNGYQNPNQVFEYADSAYSYDLYVENAELKPKVAITTKNTNYYYDSSLSSNTGKTLLKDRYVMVYTAAYENGMPVSYLVTSDYFHDQKEWVRADSIKFTNTSYGKVSVTVSGNQYTWVNYNTEDEKYSIISGLYTNSYVPVLEQLNVAGNTWYKVPVSLTDNNNVYGYTLASGPGVAITTATPVVTNQKPTINASDKVLEEQDNFDPKQGVEAVDPEDGNITNKIEVIENTVNTNKPGTYKVTYKVVDSANQEVTKTITVTVKENKAPTITASDKTIYTNEEFNPKQGVTANDAEDGDLTNKITIKENTLKVDTPGTYKIIYEVSDSKNKTTTKEIKVTVIEKVEIDFEEIDLEELQDKKEDGEFYLDGLSWNNDTKKFSISGYCIILNHNNTKDKEYMLVFANRNNDDIYTSTINNWSNNTPYDLGSENGNSYTNSWFKGEIDFSDIPNGDYDIYLLAKTDDYFTIQLVNNFLNRNITRRAEDNNHGYNFKVQQRTKTKELQLSIREELYTTSEAPTSRNMVNGYDEIKFENNKLYIFGYSYDYEAEYKDSLGVTRNVIFENNSSYQQTSFDVGSTKGPFTLTTLDNKDKTYAWFETYLDLSSLQKGTYTLMVYTKTNNAENFDEVPDMLKRLNETKTINGKKYTIYCNRNRNNRIELKVE